MAAYYYKKEKKSRSKYGGTNYVFHVWKQGRSGLEGMGNFRINTTSYMGDLGEVSSYIAAKEGYQMTDGGYRIKRKDVSIRML